MNSSSEPRNVSHRGIFSASVARPSASVSARFICSRAGLHFTARTVVKKLWYLPLSLLKVCNRMGLRLNPNKTMPYFPCSHVEPNSESPYEHYQTIRRNLLSFIVPHHAYATTYYIDSKLGNDMWSGKRSARAASTSTDGPWQSLNRLAAATLSPGGIVAPVWEQVDPDTSTQ